MAAGNQPTAAAGVTGRRRSRRSRSAHVSPCPLPRSRLRWGVLAVVSVLSACGVVEGLPEQYQQVLDHLYGPTRLGAGTSPEVCAPEADCKSPHFHQYGPTPAPKQLRMVALLEAECPVTYDFRAEHTCNNHANYVAMNHCLDKGLPFADNESAEMQREKIGYYKAAYTAIFRRVMPVMWQRGWQHFRVISYPSSEPGAAKEQRGTKPWQLVEDADIIICSTAHFREMIVAYPDKRYILVAINDAATIPTAMRCDLEDGRILALLQHTSLSPLSENNEDLKGNRRHYIWLSGNNKTFDSLAPITRRALPLSPPAMDKVETMIPQVYRWKWPLDCGGRGSFTVLQGAFSASYKDYAKDFTARLGRRTASQEGWRARRKRAKETFIPYTQRKYDIALVSTISNRGNNRGVYGINRHRQQAQDAVNRLQKRHPHVTVFMADYKIRYTRFIAILRDSRVVISPFGLGEFSGKDYEAMLAGALLVKPLARKLKAYPNIYSSRYALDVEVDFSNLEEAVMPYLESITLARTRIENTLNILQRYSTTDQFADDLEELLRKVAARPTAFDPRGCFRTPDWLIQDDGTHISREAAVEAAQERVADGLPVYPPTVEVDANSLLDILPSPPPPERSPAGSMPHAAPAPGDLKQDGFGEV
mmetsp:Transcript_25085/g.65087  ORF Transcript_25085/g.65087 Transcript_25085/m.65087 type:complete len:648 (+) Transcript_25085:383-2326(+)